MLGTRHLLPVVAIAAVCAGSAVAQYAISARAGMVNHTEGKVLIDGKEVVQKSTEFPELKEGQELRTEEGRAELMLTPGVFLRVAENSAVKMVANRLSDTRVSVLSGSAIVECAEISKEHNVTMLVRDAQLTFRKHGVFRIDAEAGLVRTYDGEAVVTQAGQMLTLKSGQQTRVGSVLAAEKFNNKMGDPFFRWAARRAEYIAMANFSAARRYDGRGPGFWTYDPYFGFFTYIPGSGMYRSFFGATYYSPGMIWSVLRPAPGWGGGGGYNGPGYNPSYGYSTVPSRGAESYSGPPAASSTATSVSSSAGSTSGARSSDASTGRGDSGGRGR